MGGPSIGDTNSPATSFSSKIAEPNPFGQKDSQKADTAEGATSLKPKAAAMPPMSSKAPSDAKPKAAAMPPMSSKATSSGAEPTARGSKGSTGFAFGFASAARAEMPPSTFDTSPLDAEILRKTMEGIKLSDSNKSTQSPIPTSIFGDPTDVKPSDKNALQMQGEYWTFYEEHQLKRQMNANMSIKDIAQEHFRTEGAIRARMKQLS